MTNSLNKALEAKKGIMHTHYDRATGKIVRRPATAEESKVAQSHSKAIEAHLKRNPIKALSEKEKTAYQGRMKRAHNE